MIPAWLAEDWTQPVTAEWRGHPSTRSASMLAKVVEQFQVETAPRYARRDITGDGRAETFCNAFARDVMGALGCPLPWGLRANELTAWLTGDGREYGWGQVDAHQARSLAEEGLPVLACWFNRNAGPGHIAVVVPSRGADGLWIAQAGAHNFTRGELSRGFGSLPVSFFAHH